MTSGQLSDQNDVKAASWHKLNPLFPKMQARPCSRWD